MILICSLAIFGAVSAAYNRDAHTELLSNRRLAAGRMVQLATDSDKACQKSVEQFVQTASRSIYTHDVSAQASLESVTRSFDVLALYPDYPESGVNHQCRVLSGYKGCSQEVLTKHMSGYHVFRCPPGQANKMMLLNAHGLPLGDEDDSDRSFAACLTNHEVDEIMKAAAVYAEGVKRKGKAKMADVDEEPAAEIVGRDFGYRCTDLVIRSEPQPGRGGWPLVPEVQPKSICYVYQF